MIAIGLLISAGAAAEDAAVTVETENAEDCVGPWGATYVECREFMFRDLPAPDGGLICRIRLSSPRHTVPICRCWIKWRASADVERYCSRNFFPCPTSLWRGKYTPFVVSSMTLPIT